VVAEWIAGTVEAPRAPIFRLPVQLGSIASEEMKALNRAMFVFLGLAGTDASQQ
jgi:hypothetical protein